MTDNHAKALTQLWCRLARVTAFSFTASNGPGSTTDWRGHARGTVELADNGQQLLFLESAHFTHSDGREMDMRNRYRWTLLPDSVRLEHLRRAEPVLLFELQPVTAHGFRQVAPHLCGADEYTAELLLHANEIELIWQIHGPRKNERLHYHYW
ncbi:DUF6314 family protein [Microbulbifer marinus]|uniref:DUF6314 domain-containing protein n=1 Tax=Microbulbifer marinus TaxID=658218 RepID=A0A1H3YG22_9GAMM|nr:DUF6314 family protein [Microbulbifer marinus]SEA09868.1 hypothetical protein SAMN05216562_1711 [Microbulbifer marinus]